MKLLTIPILVEMANRNAETHGNSMKDVRQIVTENDVVVAVWQDFTRPTGIALLTIKGDDILRESVATNAAFTGKVTAIRCIEEAQAYGLIEVYGTRDRLN